MRREDTQSEWEITAVVTKKRKPPLQQGGKSIKSKRDSMITLPLRGAPLFLLQALVEEEKERPASSEGGALSGKRRRGDFSFHAKSLASRRCLGPAAVLSLGEGSLPPLSMGHMQEKRKG